MNQAFFRISVILATEITGGNVTEAISDKEGT
jgi:hypothetical protein